MKKVLVLVFVMFGGLVFGQTVKSVNFLSKDSLTITADLYIKYENKETPLILLFHQAGWSRGEYKEIAPKLNELGFNCIAIDQRSGGKVNDVINQTSLEAEKKKLGTNYTDAMPDLEAAVLFAKTNYADGKIIGWGSSYSSALVLKLAGDNPGMFDVVLSFAPGEYFAKYGKSENWIRSSAKKITVPVFITSAKEEKQYSEPIYKSLTSDNSVYFLPETAGNHGSRALWAQFEDSKDYWKAVKTFLAQFK